MVVQHKLSHSWWFQSKNRAEVTNQSPWLTLTLSELEDKTKQMLELIEDDSDSFARRAEMYYKKRPQLVNMIEDIYRTHRSLAEQYDQLKTGVVRRSTSFSPSLSVRSCSFSTSNSEDEPPKLSLDSRYTDESEVDDPFMKKSPDKHMVCSKRPANKQEGILLHQFKSQGTRNPKHRSSCPIRQLL